MFELTLMVSAMALGAPPQYHAEVLPQLDTTNDPNLLTYMTPHGVNDSGVVTGELGSGLGFVWSPEEGGELLQTQIAAFATGAYGNAVNNAGTVAGVYVPTSGPVMAAFTLTSDGVATPLPTLGEDLGAGASDINDSGFVVGAAETEPPDFFGGPTTAAYWVDGVLHDAGGLGGTTSGFRAVNNNGMAVGAANTASVLALKPFRWTEATGIEVLPQFVQGVPATPADVNDNGLIVGRGGVSLMQNKAVYWTPDKVIHELPSISNNPVDIGVLAVNNAGVMVGHELTSQIEPRIWIDGEVFDLNSYVTDLPGDVVLGRATDINESGQIVVEASTIVDGQFQFVSVLLTPESSCFADCDGNGTLNILDFVCFQGHFQNGDDAADCDGDGSLNILDFVCFQGAFAGGCP